MSDPTLNRWFQFHLSTAIAMVLVAALLILLNIDVHSQTLGATPLTSFQYRWQGWPAHMRSSITEKGYWKTEMFWHPLSVLLNLTCFIVTVFFSGLAFEYAIRRRDGRKP